MRNGKMILSVMTVFFVLILVVVQLVAYDDQSEVEESPFSLLFSVQSEEHTETITSWRNPDGIHYVFLPGYAEMDHVYALPGTYRVSVGGYDLKENMSCDIFSLNEEYTLEVNQNGTITESKLAFVRSGNIPTMYIDVQSHSMDYIHLAKTNEETGQMRLYGSDGKHLISDEYISIKGRGNTSWDAEKKPYNITLSEELDLLNMGAAQKWILLAEGHNETAVRNKIVYDFAKAVNMPFSPDSEWVDLYLNGEYAGIYLLCERNEIHKERIDIDPDNSFLVSMESSRLLNAQNLPYILTESNRALRIRRTSQDSTEMASFLQSVESAILAENGVDPVSGKHWRDLIDMDSWVNKYLIEEIFANPDGGAVSQYFYMDGSKSSRKLYAGPVWDYDYAMGGEDYWLRDRTNYYTMNVRDSKFSDYISWFYPLYHTEVFYNHLTDVYEREFLPEMKKLIADQLDEYESYLKPASKASQIRWDQNPEALESDIAFIREFLTKRVVFLSDVWIHGEEYHTVHVDVSRYYDAHFAVKPGQKIPEIPEYVLSDGMGWYDSDTDEPFDTDQPIYKDIFIYNRPIETAIPLITFVPGIFIVGTIVAFWGMDYRRTKKNRRPENEPAQIK